MKCQLQRRCKDAKKYDIASINTGITSVRQSYFNTPVRSKQTSRSNSSKRRGLTLSRDLNKKISSLYSDQDFSPRRVLLAKKPTRINQIRKLQQNYQIKREQTSFQPSKQIIKQTKIDYQTNNLKIRPISLDQNILTTPKKNIRIDSVPSSTDQMQSSFVTVKDLHSAKPSRRVSPASFSKNQLQAKIQLKQIKTSQYFEDSFNEYYPK